MRQLAKVKPLFFIVLSSLALLGGCVEKDFDPSDPGDSFAAAREPYDDGLYDIALQKLGAFKSRFPYSKHAPMAELLMANAQYELGRYQEAALTYSQFARLHPRHEKADFALFRVGQSYWIDAPEAVDREQDLTYRAIEEWKTLINRYPESEYTEKAKKFVKQGERRIAESYNFIVNFYCKQEIYHACAYKALELMEDYPEFDDLRLNALRKASLSFTKMADTKRESPDSDKNIFFSRMNAAQLSEKAQTFRNLAKKLAGST